MKRILIGMIAVMMAMPVFAEDIPATGDKTTTSQPYVKTQVDLKQGLIPAAGTNSALGETVVTYTANGGGEIGERGIYSDPSSYDASADADKLITASALNTAFTTLPETDTTTLECANPGTCTLWTIVDQTAYGESITLPSGYTRLAYIQSTGTQYIDTGISPKTDTNFDIKLEYTNISGTQGIIGYINNSTPLTNFYLAKSSTANKLLFASGTAVQDLTNITVSANTVYTYKLKDSVLSINGSALSIQRGILDTTNTMYIFGRNNINNNLLVGKVYYYKIYDGDTLVRDFVPAKNASNVVGMYDIVNNRFYQNQGSGNFVAGPELN